MNVRDLLLAVAQLHGGDARDWGLLRDDLGTLAAVLDTEVRVVATVRHEDVVALTDMTTLDVVAGDEAVEVVVRGHGVT